MIITFVYHYSVVCSKCGKKIGDISPEVNSNEINKHHFNTAGFSCPNCGEVKDFNTVSSVMKLFSDN
jgi:DNA-directed RNA polymerase subunit RPC12/RpoP